MRINDALSVGNGYLLEYEGVPYYYNKQGKLLVQIPQDVYRVASASKQEVSWAGTITLTSEEFEESGTIRENSIRDYFKSPIENLTSFLAYDRSYMSIKDFFLEENSGTFYFIDEETEGAISINIKNGSIQNSGPADIEKLQVSDYNFDVLYKVSPSIKALKRAEVRAQ